MTYETVIVEERGAVGIVRLNRPQALNALSRQLIAELNAVLDAFEKDAAIGAVVLTGSEKAFIDLAPPEHGEQLGQRALQTLGELGHLGRGRCSRVGFGHDLAV